MDAVSADVPVLVVHQSGHMGAFNSKALEMIGIAAQTPNPPGGVIERKADGQEPNGVLEEAAFFGAVPKLLAGIGAVGLMTFAVAGSEMWASFDYTTAQEGRSSQPVDAILKAMTAQGRVKIDVVSYPDVLTDRDHILKSVSRDYDNGFRIGGAKLTIDGSPQGFTAWRDRPYYAPVGTYPPNCKGYAAVTDDQVLEALDWAYANNIQILVHSNGDAADDLLIAAVGLGITVFLWAPRSTTMTTSSRPESAQPVTTTSAPPGLSSSAAKKRPNCGCTPRVGR